MFVRQLRDKYASREPITIENFVIDTIIIIIIIIITTVVVVVTVIIITIL